MIHIIACTVSLLAVGSAAVSPPPSPGFSNEVIQAGRASHIKTSSAMNSPARSARRMLEYTTPPEPKGIPVTREAILEETRKPRLFDLNGEVRALGAAALDVLLEILADEGKWDETTHSIFGLPKVAHRKSTAGKKDKKAKETEETVVAEGAVEETKTEEGA